MTESEELVSVDQQSSSGGGVFHASPTVVTLHDPSSPASEAIGALRTHFVTQEIGNGLGAVAICGPSRHSGSSFVAVNLAVALSQIGINTLLIDADMRNPSVDRMITPPDAVVGLQQCLSDEVTIADSVQFDVLPNLSILFSGGPAANAQELLSGLRFRELLDFCAREFDVTLLDTPPANQYADSRQVAAVAGSCLVVARKHHTLLNDVRVVVEEMGRNDSRVIGTILTDF